MNSTVDTKLMKVEVTTPEEFLAGLAQAPAVWRDVVVEGGPDGILSRRQITMKGHPQGYVYDLGTGATVAYHKMWLGTAEADRFTPGSKPAVLEVDGWRLGLAVCKDTGVPRHAADQFRHEDSEGFVRLWGLGIETWAMRQGTGIS